MKKIIGLVAVLGLAFGTNAQAADGFLLLRVSSPLVVSGGAGLQLGSADGSLRPTIQAEAGVGGGKIAVGLDKMGQGAFGYGIKAAFLRTWLKPLGVDEGQNFLGLEGEASIQRLVFNLGGYRRIGDGDDDWMASGGIGFLF